MNRDNGVRHFGNHFAAFDDLDESERLLTAFSAAAVIGLSVCDDELRFLGVNGRWPP
jgi:hypothetical protein